MNYNLKNLTIIQNFICTQPARLEMIKSEVKKMSKIFKDCKFIVNYNSFKNLKEVKKIYELNINKKHLCFSNDMRQNFAETTISLLEKVNTDYVLFICEDFTYLIEDQEYWEEIFHEISVNNLDFCMLAKIEKYNLEKYHKNYKKGNKIYLYHSSDAPTNRGVVSIDAIYKTNLLNKMLYKLKDIKEIKMHDGSTSKYINMPNFYEQYFLAENGMKSLDWQCAIPKEVVVYSYHPESQSERPW